MRYLSHGAPSHTWRHKTAMKNILVCQHDPGETLRHWESFLKSQGINIHYADFSQRSALRPRLNGHKGLVLLGGSINAHEAPQRPHLLHEMNLVRQAAAKNLLVLGICLGSQLVAQALGGKVTKSRQPEIGWHSLNLTAMGRLDPLFEDAQIELNIFQWHEFEFSLPKGASLLASSQTCANQAFRLGSKILGTQFHFETDGPTIARWLKASSLKNTQRATIRKDSKTHLAASTEFGRGIWEKFAALL